VTGSKLLLARARRNHSGTGWRPGSGPCAWNPAAVSTNIALSGSNLVATNTAGSNWGSALGSVGVNAAGANSYFEVVFGGTGPNFIVGIGTSAMGLASSFPGEDANGWSFYNDYVGAPVTLTANLAVTNPYGSVFGIGDNVGVLLKNGNLYFRLNGVWLNGADPDAQTGYAFGSLTGTMYPAIGMYDTGSSCQGIFSPSSLVYPPPSSGGFAWGS
jgi:hypothetical protein